jgi:ABC-type polysaccharide/polyol phosphate transport system ATPase subunit
MRRRERLMHPARHRRGRLLEVLKGISFDVKQGEFFAVVGRNGAGKSTLLRLLASIYSPDAGKIRARGSVAPFIEMGIGFNTELSARENVVLNGIMLGNTPRQMRPKIDAVLEFAQLRDFGDMKLKNFSSGMRVRLAFAVMLETDPDILLIDEVLGVGDAAFRDRISDTFRDLTNRGKTIIFVTHQVATVERECHRGMLLEGGEIREIGDPKGVVQAYFDLNLHRDEEQFEFEASADGDLVSERGRGAVSDMWLAAPDGSRVTTVGEGIPIEVRAAVKARQPIKLAGLRVDLRRERGARIFMSPDPEPGTEIGALAPDESTEVKAVLDNRLPPGRYTLRCTVLHSHDRGISPACPARSLTFDVTGRQRPDRGVVELGHEVSVQASRATGPT